MTFDELNNAVKSCVKTDPIVCPSHGSFHSRTLFPSSAPSPVALYPPPCYPSLHTIMFGFASRSASRAVASRASRLVSAGDLGSGRLECGLVRGEAFRAYVERADSMAWCWWSVLDFKWRERRIHSSELYRTIIWCLWGGRSSMDVRDHY